MTKEQIEACEKLAAEKIDQEIVDDIDNLFKVIFTEGFQSAQSPEMLILNPIVKGLVEALEMAKFCTNSFIEKVPSSDYVTQDLMKIEVDRYAKALAPFTKESNATR